MIEIETSTIDPFLLSIRTVISVFVIVATVAPFWPGVLTWRHSNLYSRIFTIGVGSTAISALISFYIRTITLDPGIIQFSDHWQLRSLPNLMVTIGIAFYFMSIVTYHMAAIEAKIEHKRWVKIVLFVGYAAAITHTVLGMFWPSALVTHLSLSESREMSYIGTTIQPIFPIISICVILSTVWIVARYPTHKIWQLVVMNVMIVASWLWVPTAFGQLFDGFHTNIVHLLGAIFLAYFYYQSPDLNVTRRINLARQQALQRTDFLYRIGRLLNENLESSDVFNTLVTDMHEAFKAQFVSLALFGTEQTVESQYVAGISSAAMVITERQNKAIATQALVQEGNDLACPIIIKNELLGILQVEQAHAAGAYEQDLLRGIAQQTGTAIRNTQLLAAEQKARVEAEVLFDVAQAATKELQVETEARKELEIAAAIQDERDRIGRETHDGLLQRFTGQRLRIDYWRGMLTPEQTQLHSEFDSLENELGRGTTELRRLIQGLHTGEIQTAFGKKLAESNALAAKTYGFTIHNTLTFDADQLGREAQHELARIIQEAVNNAGKHAQATDIWLKDQRLASDEGIEIQIQDNGVGFETANAGRTDSFGLKNMKVRTALLGGTLRIDSTVGKGTTVTLRVPFEAD